MLKQKLTRLKTTNYMVASRPKDSRLYDSEQLFENWRNCELVAAGFANLSLVFATLDYELYFSDDRSHNNCSTKNDLDTFRYLVVVCSFVGLYFLVLRHYHKSAWKEYLLKLEGTSIVSKTFADEFVKKYKKRDRLFKPVFFLEIILLVIQPYPGLTTKVYLPFKYQNDYMSTCYTLSELFYCFMFLRLLLLMRAIANYTPYENYVARRYCHRYNVKPNMRFSFKCMMKMYPMPIVIFVI